MVFQILKSKNIKEPMFNAINGGLNIDDMQRYISDQIFKQIKNTPALVGILDTLVTDHFMGDVDYYDLNGKALGSTNWKRAKNFWVTHKASQIMYGMGVDYFSDGSCFGWYDSAEMKLSAKQKEDLKSYDESNSIQKKILEEVKKPRSIGYLAASTTEILHDSTNVLGYKQEASGMTKLWNPEQVVHIKLMEFNGEVRGFSGLKALVKEIALMYMIKENMLAKLQNGGSADTIIYTKNTPGGMNKAKFEKLRTALESFSHLRKSHGNMPIDIEVGAIPLGEKLKDMEYKELAMFALSDFCLALGVPTSRIPFMTTGSGGTSNKGELSGTSEDAYQRKVNNRRTKWEDAWNPVFAKAGFTFKYRRDNLQDEVRETTAASQRTAFVASVQDNLQRLNKQLTIETALEMLSGSKINIGVDDIEDYKPSEFTQDLVGVKPTGNLLPNSQLNSRVSKDNADSKTRTATNNGVYV